MGNIKWDFVILNKWIYNAEITFRLGYIKQIQDNSDLYTYNSKIVKIDDLLFNTIIDIF